MELPGFFLFFLLRYICFYFFSLNICFQQPIQAHVDVGDPHHGETGNNITPPAREQQSIVCDDEQQYSYIMAETIFAGKQVEEFSFC